MKPFLKSAFLTFLFAFCLIEITAAQTTNRACSPVTMPSPAQTVRCNGGITIIAENGAQYTLKDTNHDGHLDVVEVTDKALLLEVPKQPRGRRFQVFTPQAVAAVRGTKWAVDVAADKTSVFVVNGRVAVGRRAANSRQRVVLGPGEGVDVGAAGPLIVKHWAPARVSALMARLGQ